MELLLSQTVFVLISTKSRIPDRFLDLFAEHKDLVHVQVGLTTTDDRIRRLLEPNSASVDQRLQVLGALVERGVRTDVRVDPLTPGLTDTETSFKDLCRAKDIFGSGKHLMCLEDLGASCGFQIQHGHGNICSCPVRFYLYMELDL